MRQTVAILPGIVSGPHTTRRLRRLLQQAGYLITLNIKQADIVLAHSAGCLWLPKTPSHQLFVIVNPPYWPSKTIRERVNARSHSNFQFREHGVPLKRWLARQLWALYYAARNPMRTRYALRNMAQYNLENTVRIHDVVLVRNKHDDWLTPELSELQRLNPKLRIVELPGEHDDFNYHPERYVDLLQSFVRGVARE